MNSCGAFSGMFCPRASSRSAPTDYGVLAPLKNSSEPNRCSALPRRPIRSPLLPQALTPTRPQRRCLAPTVTAGTCSSSNVCFPNAPDRHEHHSSRQSPRKPAPCAQSTPLHRTTSSSTVFAPPPTHPSHTHSHHRHVLRSGFAALGALFHIRSSLTFQTTRQSPGRVEFNSDFFHGSA